MALVLTAGQSAKITDAGSGAFLSGSVYTASSDNAAVATTSTDSSGILQVTSHAGGNAGITVVRTADGFTVTHTVTVNAPPFDWTLGTPQ